MSPKRGDRRSNSKRTVGEETTKDIRGMLCNFGQIVFFYSFNKSYIVSYVMFFIIHQISLMDFGHSSIFLTD